jgi:hypothetical protein
MREGRGIYEFDHFIIDSEVDGEIYTFDLKEVMKEFKAYALELMHIRLRDMENAASGSCLFRDDIPLRFHHDHPLPMCEEKIGSGPFILSIQTVSCFLSALPRASDIMMVGKI